MTLIYPFEESEHRKHTIKTKNDCIFLRRPRTKENDTENVLNRKEHV